MNLQTFGLLILKIQKAVTAWMYTPLMSAHSNRVHFFGLPVERIEVKSNWCYDESAEDEESAEFIGVQEFYLFIKLPSQKEFNSFSTKIEDKYGPIRSYEINMDDDSETPMWFSFMTMMTFTNYEAPFVSEKGEKYILVKYRCAHGG